MAGTPASDTVTVTWAEPSFPGTIDGINYATISSYSVACSGALAFKKSVGTEVRAYTHTAAYTSNGAVKCTVTANNSAGLSASSPAVTVNVSTLKKSLKMNRKELPRVDAVTTG